CDGYGVRLAAKTIGLPVPHRMTGADWIWGLAALCEATQRSLYLLGSDPGASQEAAACLKRWYPRLDVRGTHHGYFEIGTPHSERVIEHIAEHNPDVLLVGMGTPLQELWVDHYFERLDARVVWTVGALFDYVSGREPRAPRRAGIQAASRRMTGTGAAPGPRLRPRTMSPASGSAAAWAAGVAAAAIAAVAVAADAGVAGTSAIPGVARVAAATLLVF